MQAQPREFEYHYVGLEFIDEDVNIIQSIKEDLKKDKRVEYVDYNTLEAIDGVALNYEGKVLTIITYDDDENGKNHNDPIEIFKEVAERRCGFITGFKNCNPKFNSEIKPPSEFGIFRRRYYQYLHKPYGEVELEKKGTKTTRTFESE